MPDIESMLSGGVSAGGYGGQEGYPQPGAGAGAAPEEGPEDPSAYGAMVAVATLKKLSMLYTQLGDESLGNQVDAMAVKLNKLHLKRKDNLTKAFDQVKTTYMTA